MATIIKRGDRQWQAKVRRRGYPAVSKTFELKARAEQWVRLIESEMDAGSFVSSKEAEKTTLREALNRYKKEITPRKKGAKQEGYRIEQWKSHPLARRFLVNIRGVHLAEYRDERIAQGKSPITVKNDLIIISHLFNTARKDWGMESLKNPVENMSMPKQPPGRDRRLFSGEEEKLLEHAEYPLYSLIVLAIETAMRRGELLSLTWENVDLKTCVAVLPDTKNGTKRVVPLSSSAIQTLKSLPRQLRGKIFPKIAGDQVSHRFLNTCRAAKIKGLRFHDLRHEATSRLFEKGLGIMEVAAITGHKTLHMLKRYTHLKAEDLVKRLG